MGNLAVRKDEVIFEADAPVREIGCIIKGNVRAVSPEAELELHAGDVLGITDLTRNSHSFTYYAKEDGMIVTYGVNGEADGGAEEAYDIQLFRDNATLTKCALISSIRITCELLQIYQCRLNKCRDVYELLHNGYADYKNLCKSLLIPVKLLPQLVSDTGAEELIPEFVENETVIRRISVYYQELQDMNKKHYLENFAAYPLFSTDIMRQADRDLFVIMHEISRVAEYESELSELLMNENSLDFFDIYTSLYYHCIRHKGNNPFVASKIAEFEEKIKASAHIEQELWELRINAHHERTTRLIEEREKGNDMAQDNASYYNELVNSMDMILKYGGCEPETEGRFKKLIMDYKKVIDKNSGDQEVRKLRQNLTETFYQVYACVLKHALKEVDIPVIIRMFLNFGYVDEELAGIENAVTLYSIADRLHGLPDRHIYTAYEWFSAIYQGVKQPRRNEYDVDYQEYVHEQLVNKVINKQQEKELLENADERLDFELKNFFTSVNKMTFGRISTFCPVFSENNVIADLNMALVAPHKVIDLIEKIRQIDYSAFYREELFYDEKTNVREMIQTEFLPDVILMPNVGSKGVMWQEIEGRYRNSCATFVLPIFLLESMENTLIRMTGEYRFEMCKRTQGARWNDVSERSLTSEYCDYVQFYRKNNELTAAHKEQVKSALLKARNSYKLMFSGDYLAWVLYESKGGQRLNRVSRRILFTYCPFSKEIRNALLDVPVYKELISRYDIRKGQALTRINGLIRKLEGAGKTVPEEIYKQKEYEEM